MSIFIFSLLSDFQQKSAGTELHDKVVVPGGDFEQRTRRADTSNTAALEAIDAAKTKNPGS